MPPNDQSPRSLFGRLWAPIAVVLIAFVLALDFFTKSIGLVEKMIELIGGSAQPIVVVTEVPVKDSSSCLKFAFENLAEDFVLGNIRLEILAASGPDELTGNMASTVLERTVNFEITPAYLVGGEREIVFPARIQAERAADAAFVDFCPTLTVPGTTGTLTVRPTFFSPAGQTINTLSVRDGAGASLEGGIMLTLLRSKNETVTISDQVEGQVP